MDAEKGVFLLTGFAVLLDGGSVDTLGEDRGIIIYVHDFDPEL